MDPRLVCKFATLPMRAFMMTEILAIKLGWPEGSRKTEPNEQKEDLPKDDPVGTTGTTRISDSKLNHGRSWEVDSCDLL